jgi:hypothetical protein
MQYDCRCPFDDGEEETFMNGRSMLHITLALSFFSPTMCAADNPAIGTWKQNLSKSKYTPGPAPSHPSTLTITENDIRVQRMGEDGKLTSYSYQTTYDGKPQKVTGSPYGDTVMTKRVDSHTSEVSYMRNGKTSRTSTRTVSKDGKTMTITAKGTDQKGQQYSTVTLFEKQ